MAELDVDALKQSTKDIDNPTIGMDSHRSAVASFIAQRHAIIAALEDREGLRADVRMLAKHLELGHDEYGWHYTEDGVSVGLDLDLPALRAALEWHDG